MLKEAGLPLELFLAEIARKNPHRVPGTAVFMTSSVGTAPPVMLHHLKHNKILHERVVLVSIVTEEVPFVSRRERVESRALGSGFFQVIARYGFMETPDVPALLALLALAGRAERPARAEGAGDDLLPRARDPPPDRATPGWRAGASGSSS